MTEGMGAASAVGGEAWERADRWRRVRRVPTAADDSARVLVRQSDNQSSPGAR